MSYHEQVESRVTLAGGPNQLTLKSLWMTCGKGERPTKFVDSWFSAKLFECTLSKLMFGVNTKGLGERNLYQPHKLRMPNIYLSRQTVGAKVHGRKEKAQITR